MVNWEELQAYFAVPLPIADASCRYKKREIFNMLKDLLNKFYFHSVTIVVTVFERVKAHFQATDGDIQELLRELVLHHKSLQDRVVDRMSIALPQHKVDYGPNFRQELNAYLSSLEYSAEAAGKANELKERCLNILQEALTQVEKRLQVAKISSEN